MDNALPFGKTDKTKLKAQGLFFRQSPEDHAMTLNRRKRLPDKPHALTGRDARQIHVMFLRFVNKQRPKPGVSEDGSSIIEKAGFLSRWNQNSGQPLQSASLSVSEEACGQLAGSAATSGSA